MDAAVVRDERAAPAVAPPPPVAAAHRRADRLVLAALAGLAAGAGTLAVVVSRWLFPLYSANRDDSVYVAMARLLQRGAVTLPADQAPFAPWASGVVGGRVVLKYTPPWPAFLAAGDALTGTMRAGLFVTAAAAVVAVYALAVEVLHDRRQALVAAALLVVSPLFIVQSATYLPYVFSLALAAGATALVLSGIARQAPWRLAAAGALAGIAAFARPFDAALVIAPVLVAAVVAGRHRWGELARRVLGPFLAGALPVAVLALVYDAHTMGAPFRLPFSVTGHADAFGFGRRGVFEASTVSFDFGDGLAGTWACLRWLASWSAGGVVLVALAAYGTGLCLRRGRGIGRWALAAWWLVVPFGYLAFWGPWAISYGWDGVQTLGPSYHLALLVPLVVFGACGLVTLVALHRWLGMAMIVAMVGLTVMAVPDKVARNDEVTADFRRAQRAVEAAGLDDAVLFLPLRGERGGFLSVTPFLENDPELDQPVLYAPDAGHGANATLLARFPGRCGYVLADTDGHEHWVVRPLDPGCGQ